MNHVYLYRKLGVEFSARIPLMMLNQILRSMEFPVSKLKKYRLTKLLSCSCLIMGQLHFSCIQFLAVLFTCVHVNALFWKWMHLASLARFWALHYCTKQNFLKNVVLWVGTDPWQKHQLIRSEKSLTYFSDFKERHFQTLLM